MGSGRSKNIMKETAGSSERESLWSDGKAKLRCFYFYFLKTFAAPHARADLFTAIAREDEMEDVISKSSLSWA